MTREPSDDMTAEQLTSDIYNIDLTLNKNVGPAWTCLNIITPL